MEFNNKLKPTRAGYSEDAEHLLRAFESMPKFKKHRLRSIMLGGQEYDENDNLRHFHELIYDDGDDANRQKLRLFENTPDETLDRIFANHPVKDYLNKLRYYDFDEILNRKEPITMPDGSTSWQYVRKK